MLAVLTLWFGISVPLVFLGAYFGYKKDPIEFPVVSSNIPREIPTQPWYLNPLLTCLLGKYAVVNVHRCMYMINVHTCMYMVNVHTNMYMVNVHTYDLYPFIVHFLSFIFFSLSLLSFLMNFTSVFNSFSPAYIFALFLK